MSGAADEKKKATPVGVANVERRTWNEQEYEEKAAQRDEEVKILFGRIGREETATTTAKTTTSSGTHTAIFQHRFLSSSNLKTGCARRGGVEGRRPQAQEDR